MRKVCDVVADYVHLTVIRPLVYTTKRIKHKAVMHIDGKVVHGTRTTKVSDATRSLRKVYVNNILKRAVRRLQRELAVCEDYRPEKKPRV